MLEARPSLWQSVDEETTSVSLRHGSANSDPGNTSLLLGTKDER